MADHAPATIADDFLATFLAFRPVHATFMGVPGHDTQLPRADSTAVADEQAALTALAARLETAAPQTQADQREPDDRRRNRRRSESRDQTRLWSGMREPTRTHHALDLRIAQAETAIALAERARRPRQQNPAWATGEAIFAILSLLLPPQANLDAVLPRLRTIPDFLADAATWLHTPTPHTWFARARREAEAGATFLESALPLHPDYRAEWAAPAQAAAAALRRFAALPLPENHNPACGADHLAFLMRTAHGLTLSPSAALAQAEQAFARLTDDLAEAAARIDPATPWQTQIAALTHHHPTQPDLLPTYQALDRQALAEAAFLVTPATEYGLSYQPHLPAFANLARATYFLSYRCPPALRAGAGSVYWVPQPAPGDEAGLQAHPFVTIKTTHAAHHGSIGHHTQNTRARTAPAQLARLGGTDCAMGIAFLTAGTMVEGWACHAVDLMAEVPGFYTPSETLAVLQSERRNAASVIVDINLHTRTWTPEEAATFYRDQAGFPAARVEAEITRNTMFPATRLMYWFGVESIRARRRAFQGTTREFHDRLIAHGHVPIEWVDLS